MRPYHRPNPKPTHPNGCRPPAMWYQDDLHQPVATSRVRTHAKDLRHRGDDVPTEAVDTGKLAADHNGYWPRSQQRLGDEGKIGEHPPSATVDHGSSCGQSTDRCI